MENIKITVKITFGEGKIIIFIDREKRFVNC